MVYGWYGMYMAYDMNGIYCIVQFLGVFDRNTVKIGLLDPFV